MTQKIRLLIVATLTATSLLHPTESAHAARPLPKNAADMYRKAFERYKTPDDDKQALLDSFLENVQKSNVKSKSQEEHIQAFREFIGDKIRSNPKFAEYDRFKESLSKLIAGETTPTIPTRDHIRTNGAVIQMALQATLVDKCEWGINWDNEQNALKSSLEIIRHMRKLTELLLADAMVLAYDRQNRRSLERCLASHVLVQHIGDRATIQWLVQMSLERMINTCMTNILPKIADDKRTLAWLRVRLNRLHNNRGSLINTFSWETQLMLNAFDNGTVGSRLDFLWLGDPNDLSDLPQDYEDRSKAYYRKHRVLLTETVRLPYKQGWAKREEIRAELRNRCKTLQDGFTRENLLKSEAIITGLGSAPTNQFVFNMDTQQQTQCNALLSAVSLYLVRARTGRLPDKLPQNLPKDMFSGESFEYRKTPDSFVLKCRGKDLKSNKFHEYEFKVQD